MADLETEVKLLKKELEDQRKIHDRLDIAIEKLTDVSNSIHRMLAVHEEKLTRQEEALESRRVEISSQISELHSRVTTNTKEIMLSATKQHDNQNKEIQKIREDLNKRIGVLEKWRHVLVGCSIVAGFILHKFMDFS
jgi:predicted  nucleic acid-binding Zn-ribbon protein|tara:strand:+ start:151 stop:561 length:411 start_codon:yes stop_codon:yes gene_type:complete